MVAPAATSGLPAVLNTREASIALHQDLYTTQAQLRDGLLPGFKLPGGRWRVRREDVEAILRGQVTPAQRRAELLDAGTIEWLQELAANAGSLTEAQKDAIRSAFQAQT